MRARPLLRVHLEGKVQEIPKHGRQLLLVLDLRRAVGGDQPQGAQRRLGQVRRLALDHLDGHDAQRPNVHLAAVLLARHHLGRHPIRRAHHGGTLVLRLVDGRTEAKVGCGVGARDGSVKRQSAEGEGGGNRERETYSA